MPVKDLACLICMDWEGYAMTAYFTSRRAAIAAAGGLVVALSFGGVAQAITDTVFKYTNPRTAYYSIGHLALNPLGTAFAGHYARDYTGGLVNNGAGAACLGTGVNLPQGAALTLLRVWYKSGAGGNPSFTFVVEQLSTGQATIYTRSAVSDTGAPAAADIPIGALQIDNVHNAYALAVCINPSDVFLSARITYTAANAGD
jgi:hypothetical protein